MALKSTCSLKASMGHTRAGKQRQNGYEGEEGSLSGASALPWKNQLVPYLIDTETAYYQ